jgi:hypothetical protein
MVEEVVSRIIILTQLKRIQIKVSSFKFLRGKQQIKSVFVRGYTSCYKHEFGAHCI